MTQHSYIAVVLEACESGIGTDLSGSLRFRTRATFAESARAGGGAHVCSSYKLLKLNEVQYFPNFPTFRTMDFGDPGVLKLDI